MNKLQISKELAKKQSGLTVAEAKKVVDVFFDEITDCLAKSNRVEIRGFGTLSVRHSAPGVARNPKNNTVVKIGKRSKVYFRAGRELVSKVNINYRKPMGDDAAASNE